MTDATTRPPEPAAPVTSQQTLQQTPPQSTPEPRLNRRPGCLERTVRLFLFSVILPIAIIGSCAIFAPAFFNGLTQVVRGAGLNTYVQILRSQGSPALKVTSYEAQVTGIGRVNRDLGALSFLYGEGAEVTGTVRIALGVDIENRQFGILTCEVDTNSVRTTVGRAPFAGSAFDTERIEQEAYEVFKAEAARTAIEQYWAQAKARLDREFVTWGLGLDIPAVPNLTACPDLSAAPPTPPATLAPAQ